MFSNRIRFTVVCNVKSKYNSTLNPFKRDYVRAMLFFIVVVSYIRQAVPVSTGFKDSCITASNGLLLLTLLFRVCSFTHFIARMYVLATGPKTGV